MVGMTEDRAKLPYAEIGRRLEAVRLAESDLAQRAWAERHGVSPTQCNNWVTGHRRISPDTAERLCQLYGLTLDFIYRGNLSGISEKVKKLL